MTLSLNLPLPVANGAGTAVDVSTLGAPLTLTCVGCVGATATWRVLTLGAQ